MTTPERIVAVVVTHDRRGMLEKTLDRLSDEPLDGVIVVDNASTDGTGDWLAGQKDKGLMVLRLAHNSGGAGGFEAGLRHAAAECRADWYVVMDDDARPAKGAIAAFRNRQRDTAGAVAAAVYFPDGRICEMNRPSRNPFWHLPSFLAAAFGGGRMGFHLEDAAYGGDQRDIDAASFVGLFISDRTIRKAGYPDGRYFLYGDDVIYTLGLRKQGLRIRFDPSIRFEHECSTYLGPARVHSPVWKAYFNYRNGLIMYRYAAGWLFLPVALVVIAKWILNGRNYGDGARDYYRVLWPAILDGLRGRLDRTRDDIASI